MLVTAQLKLICFGVVGQVLAVVAVVSKTGFLGQQEQTTGVEGGEGPWNLTTHHVVHLVELAGRLHNQATERKIVTGLQAKSGKPLCVGLVWVV